MRNNWNLPPKWKIKTHEKQPTHIVHHAINILLPSSRWETQTVPEIFQTIETQNPSTQKLSNLNHQTHLRSIKSKLHHNSISRNPTKQDWQWCWGGKKSSKKRDGEQWKIVRKMRNWTWELKVASMTWSQWWWAASVKGESVLGGAEVDGAGDGWERRADDGLGCGEN